VRGDALEVLLGRLGGSGVEGPRRRGGAAHGGRVGWGMGNEGLWEGLG
jgi:hypothetical protein